MAGVNPTRDYREGASVRPEAWIDGTYSGDDVDWDLEPGLGGQDQWKQPVRVATTASVTIATALNAGDTIDGVTLAAGDRVLVKDQATPSQNGIYIVNATPYRAPDMDDDAEVLGAIVYVIGGTDNAATVWTVTNTAAVDLDTDALNWAALAGSGTGNDTTLSTVAAAGATETLDVSTARTHDVTLTADCTISLTGAAAAEAWGITVVLRQDGTGGWTVTWPGAVSWVGGSAPVLQTAAYAVDVVTLLTTDGGSEWFGVAGEVEAAAHIADTTDAHDASVISIADAGSYYTGTDVEAVLQEIGAGGIGGASGHYEVIVSGSAPPVAVTNEAEDDWLYGWVED